MACSSYATAASPRRTSSMSVSLWAVHRGAHPVQFQIFQQHTRQVNQSTTISASITDGPKRRQPTLAKASKIVCALEFCRKERVLPSRSCCSTEASRSMPKDAACLSTIRAPRSTTPFKGFPPISSPFTINAGFFATTKTTSTTTATDTLLRQAKSIEASTVVLEACATDTHFVVNIRVARLSWSNRDGRFGRQASASCLRRRRGSVAHGEPHAVFLRCSALG